MTNPVEQDGVVVPRELVMFLLGEKDYCGHSFGDEEQGMPRYWWRPHLRRSLAAAPAPELTRPDGRVNESRESEHDTQPEALGELPVIAWTDGSTAWLTHRHNKPGTVALVDKDAALAALAARDQALAEARRDVARADASDARWDAEGRPGTWRAAIDAAIEQEQTP